MTYQQLDKQICRHAVRNPIQGRQVSLLPLTCWPYSLMEEPQLPNYNEPDNLPRSPASPQVIPLEQRLHSANILQNCVMPAMGVESLLCFLKKLAAILSTRLQQIC